MNGTDSNSSCYSSFIVERVWTPTYINNCLIDFKYWWPFRPGRFWWDHLFVNFPSVLVFSLSSFLEILIRFSVFSYHLFLWSEILFNVCHCECIIFVIFWFIRVTQTVFQESITTNTILSVGRPKYFKCDFNSVSLHFRNSYIIEVSNFILLILWIFLGLIH